jgi:hypothetical protein
MWDVMRTKNQIMNTVRCKSRRYVERKYRAKRIEAARYFWTDEESRAMEKDYNASMKVLRERGW